MSLALKRALAILLLFCACSFWLNFQFFASKRGADSVLTQKSNPSINQTKANATRNVFANQTTTLFGNSTFAQTKVESPSLNNQTKLGGKLENITTQKNTSQVGAGNVSSTANISKQVEEKVGNSSTKNGSTNAGNETTKIGGKVDNTSTQVEVLSSKNISTNASNVPTKVGGKIANVSECESTKYLSIIHHNFTATTHINFDFVQNSKVLILSLPRSGSSFLGELFRQNPDFIYLYEVTRTLVNPQECTKTLPDENAEIMQNMFMCDFRALKAKMDKTNWDPRASWHRAMKGSSSNKVDLCFPEATDSLATIQKRAQQNIAVKEIFFWGPKVAWLYTSVASDLKILWLVRDVRGWVSSFLQPEPNTHSDSIYEGWHYDTIDLWREYKTCRELDKLPVEKVRVYEGLLTNLSAPMHKRLAAQWAVDTALTKIYLEESSGKYLLVQYEHLSMYSFGTTQQIYGFLERPLHNDVVQWLARATKQGDNKDRYSTFRQSSQMASIWTKRLSLEQIMDIEEIAGDLFPFFEYIPILDLLKKQ